MAKAKDGSWAYPQTAVGAGIGNGGLCATVVNTDTTCPTVQGLLMRRPLKAIDKKEGNRDQVWDFAGPRCQRSTCRSTILGLLQGTSSR